MVKTFFLSVQRKNKKKLGFSAVFAFKQAEELILFQVQPLKMLFFKLLILV